MNLWLRHCPTYCFNERNPDDRVYLVNLNAIMYWNSIFLVIQDSQSNRVRIKSPPLLLSVSDRLSFQRASKTLFFNFCDNRARIGPFPIFCS